MINGIGHTAYNTTQMDAMLDFYVNKLGFEEMFRINNDQGNLSLLYLRINDTTFIELFPGTPSQPREGRAAGYNHLCLDVSDIEGTVAWLRGQGVAIDRDIAFGKSGCKMAWIKDPDGNRIELMELLPTSMQVQAIERIRAEKGKRA